MDAELKSGSRLGRYELLTQLGRGGMASVWVAREWSPSGSRQRLVAVKAMLPELARQPDFRSMFLEEGQIVRSIDHPNVVKVHEVAEDRGILYMAMEWVEGDSLRAVIKEAKRRRAIPAELAVRIIADTAAGLHAAHELRGWDGELRNLVHCDISPHNILVGLDGQAKLVDFGVANATVHSDFGTNDKIKGKFAYMSPEQAQAQKIDRRSDIFALGIVLFELTTGERLFRGESPAHTLKLVTTGKIPDPRELHEKYPEKLALIVSKALERDASKRYQTADELRHALERYLIEERIMVATSSVGQLVRRVLGPRIDKQRVALREALVAADGVLQEGLLPSSPAATRDPAWSTPGADPFRPSHAPFSPSDPPTGSQTSGTSAPFQQTIDTATPRRRSALGGLLFAVVGVAAAVGAVAWAVNQQHRNELVSTTLTGSKAARGAAERSVAGGSDAEHPSGVSIDSLALAGQALATSPGARGSKRKEGDADSREGAEKLPENPYQKAAKEAEAKAAKEAEATAAAAEAAPAPPEPAPAAPPAPAPAEPPREAGPFSRGAAMAALGSAMTRASGCKRPDGPSGMSRAMVTFSPAGTVSRVALQPPFAGTAVGSCVSGAFKTAKVPPFTGSAVTLPQSYRVPE